MPDRLRGEIRGMPLSEGEHNLLYQRAIEGSRKDAARVLGANPNTVHHAMQTIFEKLGVEDLISAFFAMGWLNPLPYGVRDAEVRHERLDEGEAEHTEHDFWQRMDDRTKEHDAREADALDQTAEGVRGAQAEGLQQDEGREDQ